MTNRQPQDWTQDKEDHYDECNEGRARGERCRCEAINREADSWYAEPANMFEMESGSY